MYGSNMTGAAAPQYGEIVKMAEPVCDRSPVGALFDGIAKDQAQTRFLIDSIAGRLSMVRNLPGAGNACTAAPKPVFATELMRSLDEVRDEQLRINAALQALFDEIIL